MKTSTNLNIKKQLIKTLSISSFALVLAACSQTNPARIQDLSDSPALTSRSVSATSSSSTDYSTPPTNIKHSTSSNTQHPSSVKENGNIVTTKQDRIAYNRNYDEIPKGGYQGDKYTVKHGDTLFYVAWITGNDFRSLSAKNNIKAPYDLTVGQVLDVSGGTTVVVTQETTTKKGQTKPLATTTTTTTTTTSSAIKPTTQMTTTSTTKGSGNVKANNSTTVANITWQWPVKGKLIETFSTATKGIDISGKLGDDIVSAADGKVVYAGNALPGYGNLLIIKHNDDYLTAYAHNQTIVVKEQQSVKAGQKIATMGNTGTSSTRLHFEIRYRAKSVDPLKYLPKK